MKWRGKDTISSFYVFNNNAILNLLPSFFRYSANCSCQGAAIVSSDSIKDLDTKQAPVCTAERTRVFYSLANMQNPQVFRATMRQTSNSVYTTKQNTSPHHHNTHAQP